MKLSALTDIRVMAVITHQPRLRLNIDSIHLPIILHILNCSFHFSQSRYAIQCFLISNYNFLIFYCIVYIHTMSA